MKTSTNQSENRKPTPGAEIKTGAELVLWRELQGMAQFQLAMALPVSLRTLQNWERDHVRIPPYLGRALRNIAQERSTQGRMKESPIKAGETSRLIGQTITGYSRDYEGFERLLLQNGWAVVLSPPEGKSQWYMENYQALLDDRIARGQAKLLKGCGGGIKPFVAVGAAKIRIRLESEGITNPTPEDIERLCADYPDWPIEQTLEVQEDLLCWLERNRERAEREAAKQEAGAEASA